MYYKKICKKERKNVSFFKKKSIFVNKISSRLDYQTTL